MTFLCWWFGGDGFHLPYSIWIIFWNQNICCFTSAMSGRNRYLYWFRVGNKIDFHLSTEKKQNILLGTWYAAHDWEWRKQMPYLPRPLSKKRRETLNELYRYFTILPKLPTIYNELAIKDYWELVKFHRTVEPLRVFLMNISVLKIWKTWWSSGRSLSIMVQTVITMNTGWNWPEQLMFKQAKRSETVQTEWRNFFKKAEVPVVPVLWLKQKKTLIRPWRRRVAIDCQTWQLERSSATFKLLETPEGDHRCDDYGAVRNLVTKSTLCIMIVL